ncbi:MAG TPA: aldo/keto reductase [Candidatus Dormibacteraeota bacterium]|nr:aldo/keto reductase [Candidatus Dormibacteraeota bacterium]
MIFRELSRREFVAGATLTGAWLARPLPVLGAATQPLITRAIPASGEKIPAIGLGTDAFNSGARAEIRAELQRMPELGGTLVDTSDDYGDSEALIGDALAGLGTRERLFLATKLSGGGGAEVFQRSLERLRTKRVDLLQVHNLNGVDKLLPLLQEWKQAGRIRYFGVTTSRLAQHAELLEIMRRHPLDFIQVDYSIENRDAAAAILPLALERRMAVLINLPFGRSSLFRQAAGRQLPPWAADLDISSWAQYFLKYVISHEAVTCAIPGSTQLKHLEDNQGAAHGRLPDAAARQRMEQFWEAKA